MADVTVLEGMFPGISLNGRHSYRPLNGNAIMLLGKRSLATRMASRAARKTKKVIRGAAHAVAQASRVTKRVAKRIIRGVAKKVLLHGDGLLGVDSPLVSRTVAKATLMAPATAAVASALPVAAPLVPVLVNEVVNEVYDAINRKIKKGASPEAAASEVKTALEQDDDKVLSKSISPVMVLGVGAALVAVALSLKRK